MWIAVFSGHAAVGAQHLAVDPAAVRAGQEGHDAGDVVRLAQPLERLGQPEDIAGVVSFLAGPDGGWVNGQVLRANGGMA